jgi:CO/xanthine dehydrogenase Mo-binding subunit
MRQLGIVGSSVPRADGVAHVTGQTRYADDVFYPGMLWLHMARSPVARGRIRRIDTARAERQPGVHAVVTAADVPNNWYTILCLIGVEPNDEPVLAFEEVMYEGEPVCAVVAETEDLAREAASLVELDIEEQEPVLDVEFALGPQAPAIKRWGNNTFMYDGVNHRRLRFGDVDRALAAADVVVEGTYQMTPIEHAPIETQVCVAKPEPDGRLTIHSNTQVLYFTLDNTAIILKVPSHRLRLVGGTVGGGFGGKVDVITEPITSIAALKTGRPVKWRWTREEEFRRSSVRGACKMEFQDGVMRDGRIVARRVRALHDAGAYHRHSPYGVQKHMANVPGPYHIPNVEVDAYCVYTNRQPSSAMRGFAVTEASFAVEAQMDRIARTIGMDPWEIRLVNAYRNGQMKPVRKRVEDATLVETIKAAADLVGHPLSPHLRAMDSDDWDPARETPSSPQRDRPAPGAPPPHPGPPRGASTKVRGRGIAAVNYPTGMNLGGDPTQALVFCTPTGGFSVKLSSTDLGQGLKTVIAQIAAETLGVPLESVLIDTGDTDAAPHCMGTFASRGTHRIGNAVIMAAEEAKRVLLEVAGEEMEVAPEDLEVAEGRVRVRGAPDRAMSVFDVALAAHFKHGRTVSGRGIFLKPKSEVDPETGACDPDSTEAHATTVADVEVDTETGEVTVLRLASAYEVGRQVNPKMVEGQITGGSVMGIGHALMESVFPAYPALAPHPGSFSEYLIPTAADVPELESMVLEYPSANGPYGVKGIGEMTANSPIPAIVNAIYDAAGVWISDLPVTPEKVLRALRAQEETGAAR